MTPTIDSSQAEASGSGAEGTQIGDPRLWQVRDFIEDEQPQAVSPFKVVYRVLRGQGRQVLIFAAIAGSVCAMLPFVVSSPTYQSQGMIRVAVKEPSILYAHADDGRLRLFDAFVSAEVLYISSRPVLERALQALKSASKKTNGSIAIPQDVSELERRVTVKREKSLILVRSRHFEPKSAAQTVNAVLDAYHQLHREQASQYQSLRERELKTRESELVDRLSNLDKRSITVGEHYGRVSLAKAHSSKLARLDILEQRIADLDTTIAQKEANLASVDADTGDQNIQRAVLLDRALGNMTYDRAKRAAQIATLRDRYQPSHPKIRQAIAGLKIIDDAIEERRQQISTLGLTGALLSGEAQTPEKSLDELKSLRTKLQTRRDQMRADAKQLNSKYIDLAFLKEERQEVRLLLDETRRALEHIRVESQNSLPGSIQIIARGSVPEHPIEDKRIKFAVAGLIFGVFGVLGVMVLISLLRPHYRFSDELDDLVDRAPLVGVIPEGDVEGTGEVASAVHRLRSSLQLAPGSESACQVIGLTGAVSGVGSSTIALALARSFATAGFSTALVDADLVDSAITRRLQLESRGGLREATTQGSVDQCVHATDIERLDILPAGVEGQFDDESMALPNFKSVIDALRASHDRVIVDSGPQNRLITNLVAAQANQTILIVKADDAAMPVRQAIAALTKQTAGRVCLAFNFAKQDDPALGDSKPIFTAWPWKRENIAANAI